MPPALAAAAAPGHDAPERGAPEPIAGAAAPAAEKAARAFRTIGEVADDLGVSQHVLRFWETRFGQIRPLKRAGGRRYYRPEDVDLVAGIRHLLHERRYTIAGAQRVLKENGVRFVQAVGRGEAVAAAPRFQELEAEAVPGAAATGPGRLEPADRTALEGAVAELRACRILLESLRGPPADGA